MAQISQTVRINPELFDKIEKFYNMYGNRIYRNKNRMFEIFISDGFEEAVSNFIKKIGEKEILHSDQGKVL